MKIHEYQGKEIFRKFGMPTPRGIPAFSRRRGGEGRRRRSAGHVWVVKAQIHAGGRGKGGGVKLARSLDEVRDLAERSSACSSSRTRPVPAGRRYAAC